ncbi:MAG: radical SAM protein [Candidatus Omnitrophota bacterium]|nr:B12-binding domain-containing radical SAM protein [Candidatus Omnitrophota bacterium]MBU1928534.1 B12-binding domain-containing radical SAM protein [Candidatus Omnitrophota bacterium]MBU2034997.1 B12-binding domain-containing radical SAM protein [Candidatus Omnitrophota bacterium]
MKIVLIEPAATEANVYSKLHLPLLGPVYLGTILKDRGHQVEIYNEDIYQPDYSLLDADLIGISILTSTARRGYEIARKFPKEKIVLGGVHASLLPEEALAFAGQVVVGEAEDVIADIAEGRIKDRIVQGRPVQDLDKLPYPDFSLIKSYKPNSFSVVPVSTSRGCPFDCTFCAVTKVFGREYRFRSAENVMLELSSRGSRPLFFCDDNFTAHPERARTLLKLMLKNKTGKWACQVRCDAARDNELLGLMSKAGCSVVCVGFESVNTKTLQSYKKKQTLEDIVNAIRSFHKKKIKIHGMFVLGGDDDTRKTVWDTLKFAIKQKIDTMQMMILTPLPGTRVYDDLKAQKRIFNFDWSLYDGQHVVFSPKLLSAKQLQLDVMKAYTKFYSLSRLFSLLIKFRFRNALFRFIGYRIIKNWKRRNRKMPWLSLKSS